MKNNFFSLTFFSYLFIFFMAWPKVACRMQTDRSKDRQTNKQTGRQMICLLRQRIGEQTERLSMRPLGMRPLGLRPRSLGLRPR